MPVGFNFPSHVYSITNQHISYQGLTGLVIFLAKSHLPTLVQRVSIWKPKNSVPLSEPCDSFVEETLWEVNLSHAISQGQKVLTSVDINSDSIEDIIIGFDSGLMVIPLFVFFCQVNFFYLFLVQGICMIPFSVDSFC